VLAAARRSNAALHRQKNPDDVDLVDSFELVIIIINIITITTSITATAQRRIAIGNSHDRFRTSTPSHAFKRIIAERTIVWRRVADWRPPGSQCITSLEPATAATVRGFFKAATSQTLGHHSCRPRLMSSLKNVDCLRNDAFES
jgi:hypothetical protein